MSGASISQDAAVQILYNLAGAEGPLADDSDSHGMSEHREDSPAGSMLQVAAGHIYFLLDNELEHLHCLRVINFSNTVFFKGTILKAR